MAKRDYGILSTGFFTNRKINGLSLPAQLLHIYVSHGPHSNGIGMYRLPIDYITSDLRAPIGRLKQQLRKSTVDTTTLISYWLRELIDLGMVAYCPNTEIVWVHDFLDWNPISNRNVWAGRVKELSQLPKRHSLDHEARLIITTLNDRQASLGKSITRKDRHELEALIKRFDNGYETVGEPLRKGQPVPIPIPIPIPIPKSSRAKQKLSISQPLSLIVPLQGSKSFAVPCELLGNWQKTYSRINCAEELLALISWNKANPTRLKTMRGVNKHINTWLNRANKEAAEKQAKAVTKLAKRFDHSDYGDSGEI